ncbi:MAG: hypothetical protein K6C32_04875 [Bacilli bacterium]|nr:hypothetical protein [Bacilli bacterium]
MKNKKLLLVATAAMGFVALGTAGVGTAAWFASDMNAKLSGATAATQIQADKEGTLADVAVTVTYTLVQGDKCDLTNSSGATSYIYNGSVRDAQTPDPVGGYYLTAAFADAVGEAAAINSINGKTFELVLTGQGNAVALAHDAEVATAPGSAVKIYAHVTGSTIKLTKTNSFSAAALTTDDLKYAIRSNNEGGLEYLTSTENGGSGMYEGLGQAINTTNVESSTDAAVAFVGAAYYNSSTLAIRKCTVAATGSAVGTWADGGYMHGADKIAISDGTMVDRGA